MTLTSASRPSVIKSFFKCNTSHYLDAKSSTRAQDRHETAFFACPVPGPFTGPLGVQFWLQSPSCPQKKELQRLENLKKKEEAELLRKQKVEEDQRQHLEEIKMVSQEKQKLLAEKAKKKAAKKLEEAEMRLKQEEEAWRQKRLQQQEEEWEQKWQRKVAEALRNTVQQGQWERQLALERKVQRKREEERLQAKWDHPHFAEEKPEA
ncbi:uncharacterized protein [Notamacropus eugenii]|uniref:uncharacterized protein n=1 Tax=Notamacropus eugenii TaxID=9315 RepID=UPI003B67BBB1